MAITYTSQAGTQITSHAMNETLAAQTQQTGNNTVVVSDTIANAGNGQIGDGTNGIGDSYVGRLLVINIAGTQQRRMCIAEAAGTGTTYILTVHEDWDVNPVVTADTIHVPYEPADIEDGGVSNGIGFNTRTGLFELTNTFTINSTGGFQVMQGTALEIFDDGTNIAFVHESGGYFYMGYEGGGAYIDGGLLIMYNDSTGETGWQAASGAHGYLYDSLIWSQLIAMQFEHAVGADLEFYGSKFLNQTDEIILYGATLVDCKISGKGATTEIVRVNDNTVVDGLVLSNVDTLDTAADVTSETVELSGVIFSGVTDIINVRQNKTWNMIDPVWGVVAYTDLVWISGTNSFVNDRTSVNAVVQEADGTKLQDALINIYEHTQLADLVLELTTDVNGLASDSFIYKAHETNSSTTTYGGHALQAGKWLYEPFVAAQSSTDAFLGVVILTPDANIVQTTQATAITAGSGITWNDETNPSSVIEFTGGSGGTIGLAVGQTITGVTSGADGVVTQILDGDGTAGTIHLKTRDAIDFSTAETIGNGADGWTATFTTGTQQDFSIWIDGNSLTYQAIYDYLAAIQNETTLGTDGELIWEWCRSAQTQPLYATGSSFFTEMSNSKGVIVIDGSTGTADHFTDDAGVQWVPPATVAVAVTVLDDVTGLAIGTTARVLIARDSDNSEILSSACSAGGVASTSFSYVGDVAIHGWAREFDVSGTDYIQKDFTGTISSSGFSTTIRLTPFTG